MNCKYCEHKCVQKGFQKNGAERIRYGSAGSFSTDHDGHLLESYLLEHMINITCIELPERQFSILH
jgi:hypothetical protein